MTTHHDLVMTAASIAARLGQGKEFPTKAGGWMTCCPAHDDETPSLEIFVDQNIRFHCYADCPDEAIRAGIAAAGFQKIPETTKIKGGGGGIIVNRVAHEEEPDAAWLLGYFQLIPDKIYHYRNANNQVVFVVARVDANPPVTPKKLIRPIVSAKAKGGELDFWCAQAYPSPRILYNLPELVAQPNAPVLLVEGEKAADAAKLLLPNYVVISWAGGASAIKHTSWTPLTNRDVVMWPDNDEPGVAAMQAISLLIAKGRKAAKSIKMVLTEIDQTFPVNFDLADPYTDELTPLSYMLENAADVDLSRLPDVPIPADDEEVADKVKIYLEKYAAISVGADHQYVDLTSRSPLVTDMIPYQRYTKHSLEQREAEAYVELAPNRAAKRRRYIDSFIESTKKLWLSGYVYDPTSEERVITEGNRSLLNLYCGLAHKPVACNPEHYQCFIDHIKASVEHPDEADYMLDWFAAKLQNPGLMIGTMIVLSGREGCGKTIVCDVIARIYGPHNAVKIPMSDMVQPFNSQYANKLQLNVEEYNPGASKMQRDLREKVKNLITSPKLLVNTKGVPAYENNAYHSIIATTNSRTPENISFDNRRMTFIHFDNRNLKTNGSLIEDDAYFAPLVELCKTPKGLSGLCHFLMNRKLVIGRVMRPISTSMTKEAKEFIENPVYDFLRSLADSGVLPETDVMPNDDNPYSISQWPQTACAIPRSILNQIFCDYVKDNNRQHLRREQAGKWLTGALDKNPRGIPDAFVMHKVKRWKIVNSRGEISTLFDRSFCLPDIGELRFMVEQQAGEPIDWSIIEPADDPSASVVVDFPGKKPSDDGEQF